MLRRYQRKISTYKKTISTGEKKKSRVKRHLKRKIRRGTELKKKEKRPVGTRPSESRSSVRWCFFLPYKNWFTHMIRIYTTLNLRHRNIFCQQQRRNTKPDLRVAYKIQSSRARTLLAVLQSHLTHYLIPNNSLNLLHLDTADARSCCALILILARQIAPSTSAVARVSANWLSPYYNIAIPNCLTTFAFFFSLPIKIASLTYCLYTHQSPSSSC